MSTKPPIRFNRTAGSDADQKASALHAVTSVAEEARAKEGQDNRPWHQADPKRIVQTITRLPEPLAMKLEFVWKRHPDRPSKNQLLVDAVSAHLDKLIAEIEGHAQ